VARTTAGVTLGTGEGGNAFGDRFFIRGFDARNDVFVDGIRDPAVSIRENFFTEQIEILKGPSATIDGRGTTGGALNIVTKQAADKSFYNAETTIAGDGTRRVTFDVNQVINPTLAIRLDGLWQNANVSERNDTFDDRGGGLAALKSTPNDSFKLTANYVHTNLWSLPDFGVPYNNVLGAPVTSLGVPRDTYYGFINRDFQKVQQDFGTVDSEYIVNDFVTLDNKMRDERSILNYIGTIPEQGTGANGTCGPTSMAGSNPAMWTVCLNPQSRYQVTTVLADQSAATIKFDTGPVRHTIVTGAEISQEKVSIDTYTGLTSEAVGNVFANGSVLSSVLDPPNNLSFGSTPTLMGTPTIIPVDTKSAYLQSLCGLRHSVGSGRRRARRDVDKLRRPESGGAVQPDLRSDPEPGRGGRQQVGTVRPASAPRRCSAATSATPANCRGPAPTNMSWPARPITSRASTSVPAATSPTGGASIPASC
jgi:catecholate siderophore receptor